MVFSTLLTLVVVPVVYTLLARFAGDPHKVEEPETAAPDRLPGALPAHASARSIGGTPAAGAAPGLSD